MLTYNPIRKLYKGDESFRVCTQHHKKRRTHASSPTGAFRPKDGLMVDNLKMVLNTPRLCGGLDDIKNHLAAIIRRNNNCPREVCGKITRWRCSLCKKSMCTEGERKWNGSKCAMIFYSDSFFGLARSDYSELHGKNSVNWTPPSASAISRNARRVKTMVAAIDMEDIQNTS